MCTPMPPFAGGSLPAMDPYGKVCQSDAEACDARPRGPRFGGRDRPRFPGVGYQVRIPLLRFNLQSFGVPIPAVYSRQIGHE